MKKEKKIGELVSGWSFVSCLLTELFVTRVLTAHDCMQLCTLNQWHNIFNLYNYILNRYYRDLQL